MEDNKDIMADMPESEIVELVKGATFNADGSYVLQLSKTLNEMMRMFILWWQLVLTLTRSADDPDGTSAQSSEVEESAEDGRSQLVTTINAQVVINSALDRFGHAIREGLTCPTCGKKVHSLRTGGFCSTQCALAYIAKTSNYFELTPSDAYKEYVDVLDKISGLLSHTSLILNAITGIPNILRELATIPEPYKSYVLVKINEGFCKLYACILKLMIKKNELIKKTIRPIKMGVIKKPLKGLVVAVDAILNGLEYALLGFDMAYMYVYLVINALKQGVAGLYLSGESYGWMLTPRSFISPMPYTAPDATKLICELPGGSGMQKLDAVKALMPSGIQNINFEAIETAIQASFPPLTPVDYYLEPDLFQVRYLFSDLSNIVLLVRLQLEDLLTYGLDYLPKYENLFPVKKFTINVGDKLVPLVKPNLAYIWFILALMDGWAPHSQALVGSLINPAV